MSYLIGLEEDSSQIMNLEIGLWVQMAACRWKDGRGKGNLPSQKKERKFEGHISRSIPVSMEITTRGSIEKK